MFRTLPCPILLPRLFLPSEQTLVPVGELEPDHRAPKTRQCRVRTLCFIPALLPWVLLTQLARSGSVWTKGCNNIVEPVGPDMSPSHFNRQNMWRGRSSLCHYVVRPIVYSDILVSAAASTGGRGGGGGGSWTDRCATYSVRRPL